MKTLAQAAPGPDVTLLGLLSTLDNTTIGSIESWLQRAEIERENLASATVAPAPEFPGNGKTGCATEECHRLPQASITVVESQESKMATTIQSQVQYVAKCTGLVKSTMDQRPTTFDRTFVTFIRRTDHTLTREEGLVG